MLDTTPLDVLRLILDEIDDSVSLKRLCEVSKGLNREVIPYLYRSVIVRLFKPKRNGGERGRLLLPCSQNLCFTRALTIEMPFSNELERDCDEVEACLFHAYFMESDDELPGRQASPNQGENVSMAGNCTIGRYYFEALRNVFEGLQDNSLQSFSWHTGTCLPEFIVAQYINPRQKSLHEVSLITDGTCQSTSCESGLELDQLHSMSWRCIESETQFNILENALVRNAPHLKSLAIHPGFMHVPEHDPQTIPTDWDVEDLVAFCENRQAESTSKGQGKASSVLFPSLRSFSLSGTCVINNFYATGEILQLFDWSLLEKLTLWHCEAGGGLVLELTNCQSHIRLKTLDFAGAVAGHWFMPPGPMAGLLNTFEGLQDLFVSSDEEMREGLEWELVLDALANHHTGLRRLVIHGNWEGYATSHSQLPREFRGVLKHAWKLPQLKCLGISFAEALGFRRNLTELSSETSITQTSHIELLHLRVSHQDTEYIEFYPSWVDSLSENSNATLDDMACSITELDLDLWLTLELAFRSNSLPNLKVVAYGTGTRGKGITRRGPQSIFCKNIPSDSPSSSAAPSSHRSFRPVSEADVMLQKLVDDNEDFLSACPSAPIGFANVPYYGEI